jgi:4-carboxymuconolactone decarboxylase
MQRRGVVADPARGHVGATLAARRRIVMLEERMPLPALDAMTDTQRAAAEQLQAGPRKGVKGPFIPLLRSPQLLMRLEKVGEHLRFESVLPPRVAELAILCVARTWSQQFEWAVHVPLALKAGVGQATIDALREGRRPAAMTADDALVHDFVCELTTNKGVSQRSYDAIVGEWGEQALVELVGIIGYFTLMSMVLNVAHTPHEPNAEVGLLEPLPR